MGTIAQKLEYLNDTRLLLKDNINKINNVLDDNSTFRSYPQELFNGYLDILNNGTDTLWNNLEKVSQTGTEAVLENVETAPIKMVLNGNTSQETTSGRNKLPTNKSDWESGHYDTYGNKSAFATRMRTIDLIPFLPNTTYSVLGTDFYIREYDSNGTFINNLGSVYNGGTFTTNSNTAYLGISINITYSDYVENINQIAIFLNSETNKTWEPYTGGQPSPSPDYPQQVKVVTGENVVSVSGKNKLILPNMTLTMNGVTVTTYEDGRVVINGTATGAVNIINFVLPNIVSYTNNKQFTYSLFYVSGGATNLNSITSLMLKKGTVGESSYGDFGGISIKQNNYTENANKLITTIDENSVTRLQFISLYTEQIFDNLTYKLQLEEGSTATDFVPYSKTDYPINLGDIELCKINTYQDYFHKDSGKWYVHKEIGKKIFDGTETWNISGTNTADVYRMQTAEIKNYILPPTATSIPIYALCSRFIVKSADDTYKKIEGISSSSVGNIHIYMNDYNTSTSVTDFKIWLSNNNVTLYYVLATPTETEITNTTLIEQLEAISKAKSVKDKTYITQTNEELPFILDVEAIKEYEVN